MALFDALKTVLTPYAEKINNNRIDLKSLHDLNSYDYLAEYSPISKEAGGITWTANPDRSVTAIGTASGTTTNDIFNSTSDLPEWAVPGNTYHVNYSSENVQFRVLVRKNGATSGAVNVLSTIEDADFTVPLDATSMIIRYVVSSGSTVNETVKASILNTVTNKMLATNAEDLKTKVEVDIKGTLIATSSLGNTPLQDRIGEWEQGSISTSGQLSDDNRRIRTVNWTDCTALSAIGLDIDDGYKCAVVWAAEDDTFVFDDFWLVGKTKSNKPFGAAKCKLVFSESNDTIITPTDASHIIVSGHYTLKEHINSLIHNVVSSNEFPIFPYLPTFERSTISTTNEVELTHSNSKIRRSCIVSVEESYQLELDSPDYVYRLYWKDDQDGMCSTAWGRSWCFPVNDRVGISIKRADDGNFSNTEKPEQFFRPYRSPKSYFLSEIENVATRVKLANTEPGLCFLLSTDQHTMSVQGSLVKYDTISDMVVNMKELSKKVNFDGHISLGDLADFKVGDADHMGNYGVLYTTDYAYLDSVFYKWMDDAMDKMASVHPNFIYVPGNHDDNRYINKDVIQSSTSNYDYTPGEMYSYYSQRSKLRRVPNVDNNGLDYYIDFPDQKIRMFCLDSNRYYDSEHVSPHGYYNCWWYGYQDSTVTWFTNELSSIPSGWSVILCSHLSPIKEHNIDNSTYANMDAIKQLIQSFINNGGSYICTLYGHSHVDWAATTPWLEICFNSQKCPVVPNESEYPESENMPGLHHPKRVAGTASEDSWSIVIIQPRSRKVKIIRFGAGLDREFSY